METRHAHQVRSALDAALERVGDRWSFLVVEALLEGPLRFNELIQRLPGIAPNVLSQRLRRLENERVLSSQLYSQRPPRSAYQLTAEGEELAGVLRLLASWGAGGDGAEALRHLACGSALEAHWYCPTCARPVDEAEGSSLRYA
ncbi:MAG TPA: helix-turn-helix domain-containing protein [Candidatus Caenarcaniphilales bacterium]|nr:helix-turn-helix domain-containing protein [Candidatus Caenarcaniphilales bacterium]